MLNYIWLGLIGLAVLIGGFRGNIGDVGNAAVERAIYAVTPIAITLLAMMTLWLGLMRLAEKAGLIKKLGLALKPIMIWLFPEIPPNHPAMGAIIMNMAANILGLNNAATPLGLRAMNELNKLNPNPGVASNAMCMLLALNTSSVTLIPVTVIGFLAAAHSKDPTVIIGTSLAATLVAHAAAIATCKLLERTNWSRRQLTDSVAQSHDVNTTHAATAKMGQEVENQADQADASLPWVRGSKWILAATAGVFIAMVVAYAYPESIGRTPTPEESAHAFPLRLIHALSILLLPWIIFFFPFYAALRRIPVYEEFVEGAKEGFQVFLRILPYVVGMLAAVAMFSTAGGMDLVAWILSPITNFLHFPSELVPLAVIRPFNPAAAQGLLLDLINHNGPDSLLALTAGTLYGCSETTFYVIAVYFGSVNIRKTRHAIPAGLVADIVGPIASVLICRAVFS